MCVCVCVSNVIRSSWLSPIKSHEIHRKAPYSPYLLCLSAPSRTIPQDSPFRNHRNLVTSQVLHTPQSPSKQSTAPPASQAATSQWASHASHFGNGFDHLFMVIWGIDYGCEKPTLNGISGYFWLHRKYWISSRKMNRSNTKQRFLGKYVTHIVGS